MSTKQRHEGQPEGMDENTKGKLVSELEDPGQKVAGAVLSDCG